MGIFAFGGGVASEGGDTPCDEFEGDKLARKGGATWACVETPQLALEPVVAFVEVEATGTGQRRRSRREAWKNERERVECMHVTQSQTNKQSANEQANKQANDTIKDAKKPAMIGPTPTTHTDRSIGQLR